ncbi:hypothetical protein IHE44_0014425 [Lamprotornis superbus]|uniref:Uncharacterized protein n=1 Tax=Lamprotornis superbus TaxID=245042 RepID=A0A835P0K6_9PASS|nr:hypothetical protein IHE44_0014425 [Lamprotornis superbus]
MSTLYRRALKTGLLPKVIFGQQSAVPSHKTWQRLPEVLQTWSPGLCKPTADTLACSVLGEVTAAVEHEQLSGSLEFRHTAAMMISIATRGLGAAGVQAWSEERGAVSRRGLARCALTLTSAGSSSEPASVRLCLISCCSLSAPSMEQGSEGYGSAERELRDSGGHCLRTWNAGRTRTEKRRKKNSLGLSCCQSPTTVETVNSSFTQICSKTTAPLWFALGAPDTKLMSGETLHTEHQIVCRCPKLQVRQQQDKQARTAAAKQPG